MAETEKSPKLTCGSLLLLGVLAALVLVAVRQQVTGREQDSWPLTAAVVLAVLSVFQIERGVRNFFWGLIAAAFLTFHPSWRQPANLAGAAVFAESLVLATLASVSVAWYLTFHPRFAWRFWPVIAAVLAGCIGLAWPGELGPKDPRPGLLAMILTVSGLLIAVLLARQLRRRSPAESPSRLNVWTAGLLVVLAPAGGLLVNRFLDSRADTSGNLLIPLREAVRQLPAGSTSAFTRSQLDAWCWPHPWLVLPLLGFALWRTVRRGWKQWTKSEPPYAWLLTWASLVFVGAMFFRTVEDTSPLLVMIALAVLLLVFLVGDLLRGTLEGLTLPPPEEREPAREQPVKNVTV